MRNLHELDDYRVRSIEVLRIYGTAGDHANGMFHIPSATGRHVLCVIASDGEGWDHVSVSRERKIPSWTEMEQVKRLFFKDNECAMQLHVPVSSHISCHPRTLHLWRPHQFEIPRPPPHLVGVAPMI